MKKIIGLILSLTIICGVCAAVLAYVHSITEKPIADMKEQQKQAAVKAVMPAGVTTIESVPDVAGAVRCFVGKGADGKVLGYAAEGLSSKGYGGDIVLMVGFGADRKTIVCYKTLVAAETPGLGMKLNTPEFAGQFGGKDATALKLKKTGGDIEAITSATITSSAVLGAIADAQQKVAR